MAIMICALSMTFLFLHSDLSLEIFDLRFSLLPGLVQFAFGQATYFVNEGEVLTVMVLADRPYNNGPFLMTVQSQDQSAQCMNGNTPCLCC